MPDWKRMGQAAKQRRGELHLRQDELVQPGLSIQTVRLIEKGEPDSKGFRPNTLATMSSALQWPRDALERIANGEPAPESRGVDLEQRMDAVEADLKELRSDVEEFRELLRQLIRLGGGQLAGS